MLTHARTKPESKKIGFIASMLKFPSAKISKTINMLSKHGTTNVNDSETYYQIASSKAEI